LTGRALTIFRAGLPMIFKAKPARKIVRARPVKAVKASVM